MESSKYIGRVGALAVALGIGTALTTGTGLAWADESGGSSGSSSRSQSSSSSDSAGSGDTSGSKTSATSKSSSDDGDSGKDASSRKGPLSRLGERVRKETEKSVARAEKALERTQSRLEQTQTRINDRRAALEARIDKATSHATEHAGEVATEALDAPRGPLGVRPRPEQPAPEQAPTPRKSNTEVAEPAVVTPAAVDTLPKLSAPERAKSVTLRLREVREDVSERGLAAISSVAESLTTARALTPAPVTAFAEAAAQPDVEAEAAEQPELTAPSVVSALLVAAGLSPLAAGTSPVAPGPSAALWAMAAWARRESERLVNPNGTALTSATDAESPAAATEFAPTAAVTAADAQPTAVQTDNLTPKPTGLPIALPGGKLGWVTGPDSDTSQNWFIEGTDLGIMWNSGYVDEDGKPIVYSLFGDTYSAPNFGGDWRFNVLLRSSDTDLSDGLQFSDAVISPGGIYADNTWWRPTGAEPRAGATEVIRNPPGGFLGLFGSTHTIIPTSAIAIEDPEAEGGYAQYATVMSVRTWDNPGSWTTNWSAIAKSTDGGKTWEIQEDTVRSSGWLRSSTPFVPGNEHFQQNALVTSDDPDDPYVYVYGTPSGRQGSAYLARVEKDKITELDQYQYWAGEDASGNGRWISGDPSAAKPVFGSSDSDFLPQLYRVMDLFTFGFFTKIAGGIVSGGLPTGGNVSEMSVQYNQYLERYVVTYTDGGNNVVMRVSESPQGQWSDTTQLVSVVGNGGAYAPMIHPMSGTDYFNVYDEDGQLVTDNSQYLYYNLSYWGPYNVQLMQSDLKPVKDAIEV